MKMDAPRRKIVSDAVDLLTTDYEEQEATVLPANQIVDINTDCIVHYHNHLFHLYEGERLDDLVQSIQDNGVLTPVIVMRLDEENYEMLAGHNRLEAAKLAGLKRIPAIIKEKLSEQEALAYVVETNLRQRSFSDMYPSEQAAVLKVQYSQILSQGRRSDIIRELDALDGGESTSDQIDQRLDSRGRLAKEYNLSPSSIARLIRVFELIEPYKRAMDNKEITMQIAINLSYLSKAAQGWVLDKSEKLGYRLDAKASAEFRSQRNTLSEDGKHKGGRSRCLIFLNRLRKPLKSF
jgi:ParB family chromosome partitioning protein